MDNFRDSYFKVNWDLTTNSREGIYWGKQYDTGRGFVVTVINGDQVVTATNEVLRLKWEKPDNTSGYVNATIVNGKFVIENIDQMFTVQGIVRADFELSIGGKFVASTTFHVNVEKAVAVDAIESSSDFTALHSALLDVGTVQDSLDGYVDAESVRVANESIRIDNESIRIDNESIRIDNESIREAAEALRQTGYATMDEAIALKADLSEIEAARGTEPTLGARLDSTDAQLNNMTQDFTQHKLDYVEHKEDYNTLESEFTQHKLDYAEDIGTVANLTTTSKEVVGAVNELDALKADLSEIESARGTEPTLGARLDSTDAQLNNMTQDFTQHKLDYMPHRFENKVQNKTYKFGFQVSDGGSPQIIFEEVI